MIRIEIDIPPETAEHFAFLLRELNAQVMAKGEEPWTPSQLAASIIREVLCDDIRYNGPADCVH